MFKEGVSEKAEASDIQKFFQGSCVFVTGGTGFLGNLLLEKLLRSCDVDKIYVLCREKKGVDAIQRFKAIFDDVLFERMRRECPNYGDKVAPVMGDCFKPNLGLGADDVKMLKERVNVVFHVAATVRFDAHLRHAVNINIVATRDLLEMAKEMPRLKAFVHVSTAYSNCAERKLVDEKFYNPPVLPDGLVATVQSLSDDILERITPNLIQPWPNTYAFTKAIAEDIVRGVGGKLPVAVIRPAIVIATAKEPIPGWINNFYGPTGVVAGAGLGLLRSLRADGECTADLVPGDNVVNATIAAAWKIGTTWKKETDINANLGEKGGSNDSSKMIPIYNYVSSNSNRLKWKEFMTYNERAEPEIPTVLALWIYGLTLNKSELMHKIYCLFLHWIPALIVDAFARIIGKEPMLWKAYEKIHKFSEVITYFSMQSWTFVDSNTRDMCDSLSDKDKKLFDFDLRNIDWKNYFYHHIRGLRVYLVHDSLETVPKGLAKRRRLMFAHYTLVTIFWCILVYVSMKICLWILN